MTAARDQAFGRYYMRNGLRVGRSDIPPQPADRYSSWAAKYFRQPPDRRNPPSRLTISEPVLDSIIATVSYINRKKKEGEK